MKVTITKHWIESDFEIENDDEIVLKGTISYNCMNDKFDIQETHEEGLDTKEMDLTDLFYYKELLDAAKNHIMKLQKIKK